MNYKPLHFLACICLLLLPLLFCRSLQAQTAPPPFEVKWKGEMRTVTRQGDLRGTTALDTLLRKPHVYALGPLEDLQGEILIRDGQPFISKISRNKVVVDTAATDAKAAFLVYAQVRKWVETPVPTHIRNQAALEAFLVETAKAAGINIKEPFPFLLRGKVQNLQLHVMNKPAAEAYSAEAHDRYKAGCPLAEGEVEMLGFYSMKHQGIFTHHDSYTHIHAITTDRTLSGHVDAFALQPGKMKLLLPYIPENAKKKRKRVSGRKSEKEFY